MPAWLGASLKYLLLLVVLLLLLGAGLVAVAQLRPQWLEAPLEVGLSRLLERRVEIGTLEAVELGRDALVQVRDLRIANPAWADEPWLLRVGHLRLAVALPSLWTAGPVVVHELDVVGFEANLLAPGDRAPSWQFGAGSAGREAERESGVAGPPLVVHAGRVRDGVLRYRDPDQDLRVELAALEVADPGGDELISLRLDGSLNGEPFAGGGRVGPASALLTGRGLAVDLQLGWGDARLQLAGSLEDVATLGRPDLRFTLTAPRARPLLDALGMAEVRDGALHLEGQMGAGTPGITLDIDGSLGDFLVKLEGSAGRPLALDEMSLRWYLSGPSLQEAGAAVEVARLPDVPYEISGELKRAGSLLEMRHGRLLAGSSEINFEGRLPEFPDVGGGQLDVEGRGLDLRLLAPLLDAADLADQRFEMQGTLRPGGSGAALVSLEVDSPATRLVLDGILRGGPGWHGSQVHLRLSGEDLAASLGPVSGRALPPDPFELAGTLSSAADGFRVRDGRIRAGALAMTLDGRLASFTPDAELQLEFSATTPDLAATLLAWGVPAAALEPFPAAVRGRIEGSPQWLRLAPASLEAGTSAGSAEGVLGNLADPSDLQVKLALSGPDLLTLLTVPSAARDAPLPFSLAGTLASEARGWRFRGVNGQLGGTEVEMDATLSGANGFEGLELTVSLRGRDLEDAVGPWVERGLPPESFSLALDLLYRPEQLTVPRLQATLGDLVLSGQLDPIDPAQPDDTQGALTLDGPSARALLRLFGIYPEFPDGPVKGNVRLQGNRDGLRLSDIDVALAGSDVSGAAQWRFAREGQLPRLDLDLHSRRLYLPFLLPEQLAGAESAAGANGVAPQAEPEVEPAADFDEAVADERSAQGVVRARRVIPDLPLDFAWLHRANGRLRYQVDDLVVREGLSSATEIDLSVRDGELITRRLSWSGTLSTGAAEVRLSKLDRGAGLELYVHSRRLPLIWLLAGAPEPRADRTYRAYLSSRGATVRELAANLDGAVAYRGGGGRLSNKGLGLIFGDLPGELFSRINPFYQDEPYTRVICGAGAVRIVAGVIDLDPGVVLRTDKVDVGAGGRIDLRDERLSLTFSSRARRGIGISASKAITPYVKLGGTFSSPRLVLDAQRAAVSGGAAVVTAGLSIIAGGLWDRWVATAADPCERMFSHISEETRAEYAALLARPDIAPPEPEGGS